MKVLIVGGVAGGASAAARLRRLDEKAEIIVFERGEYISFANCGLPYRIGNVITEDSELVLQTPESFKARFNVDIRTLSEVIKILPEEKAVTVKNLQNGEIYKESYDNLILSPGAMPIKPPLPGLDSNKVFTLRTIPDTLRLKSYIDSKKAKKAVVVGGGFIGLEIAENLINDSLSVTLVEKMPHVLPTIDEDVAWDVHDYLIKCGIDLRCNTELVKVVDKDEGIDVVTSNDTIHADLVVLAIGIRPESKLAIEAGIACNERGYIIVDSAMRSSVDDIYAIGDVVAVKEFVTGTSASIALAGPANKQGRIVADQICGIDSRYQGSQGSNVIKLFEKTLASTGITERFAKSQGIDCEKVHLYLSNHASYYPGAEFMAIKIIFEKGTGRILGGQFFGGTGTEKRCDVLAVAIRAGMKATDLVNLDLCYAPPYSSAKDPVVMAGMAIENILTNKVKVTHWNELNKLDKNKVTFLDVRTKGEYADGHVEGFINIPLHELRDRLNELDKEKPVYVNCLSGMRSYVACMILKGHGFDCTNISGGYRLYKVMTKFYKTQENNR